MIKSKKQMLLVITIFTLILTVGSVTYAFFNYTRTGEANVIKTGRISFISRQTETINLTNLFPIDPTEEVIMNDETKVGTFEIEVEGDTDYVGGIEYLVSAVNSHLTTSTGQIVPISLDVEITGLGNSERNYFTERESKNTKIYKRLSGNGIMGDGNILVGYIPQNSTLGTASGINGRITIKAYLDKNKIAISDTYDGNETDLMGTSNDWVDGRVVLTTDEWNSLQQNGISFQVKVEANEDIWVEETLYDIIERQTVMDNINSTYVSSSTGIDFSQISSDTNGKGVYTFSSTSNDAYPVMYYRGAVENNNVLFANKCWKMVRTTDTGGVKLIYNGENKGTSETPDCDNTGTETQITLNIDGEDVNTFAFNENTNSPAYSGYMYGTVYTLTNASADTNAYFGTGFTYDSTNNLYTLTNAKKGIDENHHYTCNETSAFGTCANIRYYFTYFTLAGIINNYYYFTLSNGKSIENILKDMQKNDNDSNAKIMIDDWYNEYIESTNYKNRTEDTLWCNDQSISSLGGINPNGGIVNAASDLYYSGYTRANAIIKPALTCRKNDAFTLSNGRGNGALDYPVSLLTTDEVMLAGGKFGTDNVIYYLNSSSDYWSLTPDSFLGNGLSSELYISSTGNMKRSGNVTKKYGLRPSISLKNNASIVNNDADGTVSKPYVIK